MKHKNDYEHLRNSNGHMLIQTFALVMTLQMQTSGHKIHEIVKESQGTKYSPEQDIEIGEKILALHEEDGKILDETYLQVKSDISNTPNITERGQALFTLAINRKYHDIRTQIDSAINQTESVIQMSIEQRDLSDEELDDICQDRMTASFYKLGELTEVTSEEEEVTTDTNTGDNQGEGAE